MKAWMIPLFFCAALQPAQADDYASRLAGDYELWEDFEGGRVCALTLGSEPTIGGYEAVGDDACIAQLHLDGDVFAWFVGNEDELVLIDATRAPLLRLKLTPDGTYYAIRADEGLENLVLTPA